MFKCTQNLNQESFGSLLKDIGAWDYDDMQNSLAGGNILLEEGEDSEFDKTENISFVVYDAVIDTIHEGRMDYNTAKSSGYHPSLIDNYALAGDYLDTAAGEIEPDGKVAGFMLINFNDESNPLCLCGAPYIFNTKYRLSKFYSDIYATASIPYLYQTELPYDALGEFSPLRHINNLYLSSIYSGGNPWLIVILVGVALAIVATIIIIVVVKKKKAKKKIAADSESDEQTECNPECDNEKATEQDGEIDNDQDGEQGNGEKSDE